MMRKTLNNFKGVYMEIIREVPDNVGWNTTRCRLVFKYGNSTWDGHGPELYVRDGSLTKSIRLNQYTKLLHDFDPLDTLPETKYYLSNIIGIISEVYKAMEMHLPDVA